MHYVMIIIILHVSNTCVKTFCFRKDVRLPIQLQRAMAAEAEASREARAKVIAAEGEQKASKALREASEVIGDSPAALQLRYLQVIIIIIILFNNSPIGISSFSLFFFFLFFRR